MEFRHLFSFFFFLSAFHVSSASDTKKGLIFLENLLQAKFSEYTSSFTEWLQDYNDRNIGKSELGRLMHYADIKPKLQEEGRSKKMHSMMPMIFHIGATSTWMILTAIMATKSVAIGMILLIFKIAVSAAKLASFFTLMKEKKHDHHHDWSWSPPPHYEHHHDVNNYIEIDDSHKHAQDLTTDYTNHGIPEWAYPASKIYTPKSKTYTPVHANIYTPPVSKRYTPEETKIYTPVEAKVYTPPVSKIYEHTPAVSKIYTPVEFKVTSPPVSRSGNMHIKRS